MDKVIGIAGCGTMGLPMAQQLRKKGFDIWGYDVRPLSEFGDFQDRMVIDPQDFAGRIDVLISVVRDWQQTQDLLFDTQAIYAHPNAPKALLISSTLSPRLLADIQARLPKNVLLVDAPMSGAPFRAANGTLTFMLGGPDAAIAELMPAFNAMGQTIHHLGPTGAGLTCKVVNNFVAASGVIAVRHALASAEALGVDRATILKVMHSSSGGTWYGRHFNEIDWALEGYEPGNTMGIIKKDVAAYLDAIEGLDGKQASPFERTVHEQMSFMEKLDQ